MSDNDTGSPSKQIQEEMSGSIDPIEEITKSGTSPQTGEKRKRGRPRKTPDEVTKSSDEPKRGRGRPRKVLSETEIAAAAAAAASPGIKRGRGRPRKEPGTTAQPSTTPKKDGRGRPRKEQVATADSPSTEPKKKDGRGRPRKNPAATPSTTPKRGRGRPRKSITTDAPVTNTESKIEDRSEEDRATSQPVRESSPLEDTGRSYWLMKAEPESRLEKGVDVKFSIDDLAAAKEPEPWDGVRNPVARNIMKEMKQGDYAFFYHSNCKVPGVVGIMEIVREHSVDESAFDSKHPYYDPKSTPTAPKWVVVHVEFRKKFDNPVTLTDLKLHGQPGKALENLQTLKQSRLSVSSVTPAQWRYILRMAGEEVRANS
ncbi:AT-hook transcription factor [Penicillium ucsense]|uniref:Thymocyte nuclear protein 1 n=1 Tax=Penicillium ucsense TaxID=2839758 RepID=A0A8J8W0Y3_9EURO|nr:AT-hook transcription factor [Penicillium ucsense]KAF7735762.1 AT-hook transcription factor [Penicillium ucsense]